MKRVLPLILTVLLSTPATAQTNDKLLDQVFSSVERRLIREYYGQQQPAQQHKKSKNVPPGLAKKGGLPPGIAKKQSLPPGIAMVALPHDLDGRLPPVRAGQRRVMVDNDVLLVDMATNVVIDVLEDVFSR